MTKYVLCSAHAPHMLHRTVQTIAAQFEHEMNELSQQDNSGSGCKRRNVDAGLKSDVRVLMAHSCGRVWTGYVLDAK